MKNPAAMTPGEINRELDRLDKRLSKMCDALIATGRGYEAHNEIMRAADPLAIKYQAASNRRNALRIEIEMRYGPGAPARLPRGFKRRE